MDLSHTQWDLSLTELREAKLNRYIYIYESERVLSLPFILIYYKI